MYDKPRASSFCHEKFSTVIPSLCIICNIQHESSHLPRVCSLWHNRRQKTTSRSPLGTSDILKHRLLNFICLLHTEPFWEEINSHADDVPKLQQFLCILQPLLAKTLFCSNKTMQVTECSKISLLSANLRKVMLSPRNVQDSSWRDYLVQDIANHWRYMLLQYIKVFFHTSFPKTTELRSSSNYILQSHCRSLLFFRCI